MIHVNCLTRSTAFLLSELNNSQYSQYPTFHSIQFICSNKLEAAINQWKDQWTAMRKVSGLKLTACTNNGVI